MTPLHKMIAAGLLLTTWAALVFLKMAPVADFVNVLRDALLALGVFTATVSIPRK